MQTIPKNGSKVSFSWIAGTLLTFLIFVLGILAANLRYEVNKNSDFRVEAKAELAANEQKIANVNETLKEMKDQISDIHAYFFSRK